MKKHWWLISSKDPGACSTIIATSEKRFTSTDISKQMHTVSAISYLGYMSEDTYYKGYDMLEMIE